MTFQHDVGRTAGLEAAWRAGLGALGRRDRARVCQRPESRLDGSADVDSALRPHHPVAARWDYAIAQHRDQRRGALLHWVEVHPAAGEHAIREVAQKSGWLRGWLAGTPLASYERRLVWVASGKCAFNARDPRLKALAGMGIRFAGGHLEI